MIAMMSTSIVLLFTLITASFRGEGETPATITPHQLEQLMLRSPDPTKLAEWSKYYTSGAHLAGQNYSQAEWTMNKWKEFGVESSINTYDVYLNYPTGHWLALLEKEESRHGHKGWNVKYEALLEEDVLEDDPTTGDPNSIPTFHGYSANGNVTAHYVYVNYGTYQDFEDLIAKGVQLEGNIAIARYGGIFRGLKVKRAEELGMVGCVIYSDPGDDGAPLHDPENEYPNGPGRNPSAVQRGSVQYLSINPGDPTTIGRPGIPGTDVERDDPEGKIPSIPSLPISYVDALPILKALNGHGPRAKDLNEWWDRNLGLEDDGVKYNIGPSPDVKLDLANMGEYKITPIWNVIGVINGTSQDEVVVIGNHRDAWIVGGAGDPNSGSAALMEVVRAFGHAVKAGWKPQRTIVFASWDGEEYGLLGSTEWVEEYIPWLSKAAVAYLNMDVGCAGPEFGASSSPGLHSLINEVTAMVQSPNQTVAGQTVYDVWNKRISTMGSGSDFTAFQDWAGISSLDFGFKPNKDSPTYMYHSSYDSFHWMEKYGDPGFKYHATSARILGLLASKMATMPLAPMKMSDYGAAMVTYVQQVQDKIHRKEDPESLRSRPVVAVSTQSNDSLAKIAPYISGLMKRAEIFRGITNAFDKHAALLSDLLKEDVPWWKWWEKARREAMKKEVNEKMRWLDRQFLYEPGLDGREYFKHVIFAPGKWTGYSGAVFPGLAEAIDAADFEQAKKWANIILEKLVQAEESLQLSWNKEGNDDTNLMMM